ncbi:hypothetical protein ARMGADRAFT_1028374 [Armillaria gallica]|uniref:Uncharacterized protein n=1 Tax=Armillaria gallica TaxID=47427 RepID=A0A2H3DLU2_ARMGA|nr:hypothetical protein ARMGADRAFT_1028374 [Armillaria gallica]
MSSFTVVNQCPDKREQTVITSDKTTGTVGLGATAKVTGDEIIEDLVHTVIGFWAGRTPWLQYSGALHLEVIIMSQICDLLLRQNNSFIATGTFFRQCRFIEQKAHGLLNGEEVEAVEKWRERLFEESPSAFARARKNTWIYSTKAHKEHKEWLSLVQPLTVSYQTGFFEKTFANARLKFIRARCNTTTGEHTQGWCQNEVHHWQYPVASSNTLQNVLNIGYGERATAII